MAATKFAGKNLSILIGGVEYNGDVTEVTITNEEDDANDPTFADLSNATGYVYTMHVSGYSDFGTGSLWSYIWANPGVQAAYVLKPYGNTTASATQPHFTGNLTVGAAADIGGTAGETFAFEYDFVLTAKPTRTPA